jgi:hypothetical protein
MQPQRLRLEPLETRLAMASNGVALPAADHGLEAVAGDSPCDLECQRAETLATLSDELRKRDVAVAALGQRLSQAGDDVVESERVQSWINGWNQYGATVSADAEGAESAQIASDLAALQEKYRLTATGLSPLTELGTDTHLGFSGGLYPGGLNTRPPNVEAAGIEFAQQIVPRNAAGAPDSASGRVVLVSIGMSNTNQEFGAFVSRANAYSGKHRQLSIINGAQGGRDADDWVNPNANTWSNVDATLAQNGLTPSQVQVAWVKQARAGPNSLGGSAAAIDVLRDNLEDIARSLKIRYPNIQIAYISSRTRAYTDVVNSLNPEPFAYESGFSVQQLIARQIAGQADLNYDPARGPVVAPLLLWGPYVWADGTNARQDGFAWLPHDVGTDRTHPAASGRDKVAYELLRFFTTDSTAVPWFVGTPAPAGDLNQDGNVAITDLWILQRNFGRSGASTAGRGDLNGDQRIDRTDVARFIVDWGATSAAPGALLSAAASTTAIRATRSMRASRVVPERLLTFPERVDAAIGGFLSASRS